jgi:hypothetical protein
VAPVHAGRVAHLEVVRQAVPEDRELHLRYRSRGGPSPLPSPLGLVQGRTGISWSRPRDEGAAVARILKPASAAVHATARLRAAAFWERWAASSRPFAPVQ